jgi:Ca-activated chloride channel homolog
MKTLKIKLTIALSILLAINSFGKEKMITVNGTVVDEKTGESLVGASIKVIGTKIATVTDYDGKFRLKTYRGKSLLVSYVGYKSQEVTVKEDFLKILLEDNSQELKEVVVMGYGTATRGACSSSVSTIKAKSLNVTHSSSIGYALQGCVAGLKIKGARASSNKTTTPINGSAMNSGIPPTQNYISNDEEYSSYKENRFLTSKEQPLSTFSLDVDAASYSNIRRIINQGSIPPKDAVRIEELINYFSYNYPNPTGKDPVSISHEITPCPWDNAHKLIKIGVKAREIPSESLPASNFVFLLDVSGSMDSPNKLPLVKSSIKLLTNNLRKKDRVAIVVYAGAAGVVLESTEGTDKQKILEAVENLQAGGSTAGGQGIELAYQIAQKNFIADGNNRIILCTDGDFNVGVSSNEGLESLIESKRKSSIFLTALGYGMGNYKDSKLQILAQKGNGNHAYIDNIQEANKVLVNEFGSTMYTVAKDVKLQVEFNPQFINAYRLVGYESRLLNKEDFNDDTKDAGELGAGHTVTALYELIPVGIENKYGGVDPLKYQKNETTAANKSTDSSGQELLTIKLRYKEPQADSSKKMEIPIMANEITNHPSPDFRFAMGIAMFGQLLKNSDFKGSATYDKVLEEINHGLGEDNHGYRREFVRIVESVKQLSK